MVAANDTPNANLDPSVTVQGHNGGIQNFVLKYSKLIQDRRSHRQIREFLIEDQFGNLYLIYRAKLQDGNEYDVAPDDSGWVNRPSLLVKFGGLSDALIDAFRAQAFVCFDDASKEIEEAKLLADKIGYQGDAANLIIPTNDAQ